MPFDGSAGFSDETAVKQAHLREILHYHMSGTWGGVMGKYRRSGWNHHPQYLYWDLYSGPGRYQDGSVGSPLIALEVAGAHGVSIDAGLFEQDPLTAQRLRGVLGEARTHWPGLTGTFHVIDGDNRVTVPRLLAQLPPQHQQRAFGLVYSDSNGDAVDVPVLEQIAAPLMLQRLDFLLYVSATAYKRRRGASHCADAGYLRDDLEALGKPYLWIREPRKQWQWTFVLASAWDGLPVPKKLGFRRVASPGGQAILEHLNLSDRERQEPA